MSHYETLGVQKTASASEVKQAFNKLAKVCHPDVAKDDQSRQLFSKILEAYNTLGSEEKRRIYDLELSKTTQAAAQEEDPLLKWVKEKYEKEKKNENGTEVPPHLRGEKPKNGKQNNQQWEGDFENSKSFRLMEIGLVVSLFVGIALGVHRMRQLKMNVKKARIDPNMRDDDDFDLQPEVVATKIVRLSELDCAKLTYEELDFIDRSQNYVLPNAAKVKLAEYRAVYRIPSPEEEKREKQKEQSEQNERIARQAWERRSKQIKEEHGRPKSEVDIGALNFDFDAKYNRR